MTAGAGVPPEQLRQVLEALAKDTAWRLTAYYARGASSDQVEPTESLLDTCKAALAAASGPDAETGERVPRYVCRACAFTTNYAKLSQEHHDATGHNMRWTGREATSEELAHDIRGTAPASGAAPDAGTGERVKFHPDCTAARCGDPDLAAMCRPGLPCYSSPRTRSAPASGAAPEERDGETGLDRLLTELDTAVRRFVATRDEPSAQARLSELDAAHERIRDFVAQRERAAREEGRAEMGEVVGTMIVARDQWGRYSTENEGVVKVKDGESFRVDLVRRRGKEEG